MCISLRAWGVLILASLPAFGHIGGKLPLFFEENAGQTDRRAEFIARAPGYTLFLTHGNAVLRTATGTVRMQLHGANSKATAEGREPLSGRSHYLRGGDGTNDVKDVRQFGRVKYREVYPGIDVEYYTNERRLEYDFVVAPGGDPNQIRLRFEGAGSLSVDARGNLHTGKGLQFDKPIVYQDIDGKRAIVEGAFEVQGHEVSFTLGVYRRDLPLVIDPVLTYSTYLGGNGSDDRATAIAVDAAGYIYVAGVTTSEDFPGVPGSYSNNAGAQTKLFISKFNADGTALMYSAFLGQTCGYWTPDLAIDAQGQAIVTGCGSLPATAGAFTKTSSGGFVAKLNAAGSALLYLAYPGVSGNPLYVATGPDGSAWVAGLPDYSFSPTTPAVQQLPGGNGDVAIMRLNANGSAPLFATYLGGSAQETIRGLAVDGTGSGYVIGISQSANFPTTPGAITPASFETVGSGFAAKLNATGSQLLWSTMIPGAMPSSLAVAASGELYIAGMGTATFATTAGAYLPVPITPGPFASGLPTVLLKIATSGQSLGYATFAGVGSDDIRAAAVAVNSAGEVWVVSSVYSYNFGGSPAIEALPTTADAFQRTPFVNNRDLYITRFNAAGSVLSFATYFGGTADDSFSDVAIDSAGAVYIAGTTSSRDLPTTSNAIDRSLTGTADAFVVKIGTSSTSCSYALSTTFQAFGSQAGSGSFEIATNAGCPWTVSAPAWVTLSLNAGIGPATVSYSIAANDSVQARISPITVAGKELTVVQAGSTCSYTIQPDRLVVDNSGGIGNLAVTATGGCPWTAVSTASWITITQGQNGNGPGVVRYTVAPLQAGPGRTGSIFVAGQTFHIFQGVSGPSPTSVTPANGTGNAQLFTITLTDPDGGDDISLSYVIIGEATGTKDSCFIEYNRLSNSFRLMNNDGVTWSSPLIAGSGTLSNSQCTLNGSGGGGTVSGTSLAVTFSLSFPPSMTGARNVYGLAIDAANLNSGWKQLGTFTISHGVVAGNPEAVGLSVVSGSGTSAIATAVFRHPGGQSSHYLGYILFLPVPNVVSFNAQGTCLIEFNRLGGNFDGKGGIRLINNTGNDWLGPIQGVPLAPTTPPLSNGACTVNVAAANASFSGNDMTVTVPVSFNAGSVSATMGTFIQSNSTTGQWTDFRQFGNWTVPGAPVRPGPRIVSGSPASGAGSSATFAITAGHSTGLNQLGEVHIRFASSIVGSTSCHIIYSPAVNVISMINDAGTALVGPVGLGQPLTTNRCSVPAGAWRTVAGTNVTLNLPVNFNATAFGAGTKNVYVNGFDITGAVTHWVQTGTWTVQ